MGIINGTEGTYYFYPPECCVGSGYDGHDGRKADVWALGVSLWAFIFGSVPFFRADLASLFDAIAEARFELPPPGEGASDLCRRCICSFLASSPEERLLAWDSVQEEPWLRSMTVSSATATMRPSVEGRIP